MAPPRASLLILLVILSSKCIESNHPEDHYANPLRKISDRLSQR